MILRQRQNGKNIIMLCIGNNPKAILDYPEIVRQAIRDIASEYTGISISPSPGYTSSNTSLYLYESGHMLFQNFNNFSTALRVNIDRKKSKIYGIPKSLGDNVKLEEISNSSFLIKLPKRSYGVIYLEHSVN